MELSPGLLVKIGIPHSYALAAGEDRDPALVRRRQHARVAKPELAPPGVDILPEKVMELVGPHRPLELRPLDHLAHEGVRVEEHIVVEQDVIDPDDPLIVQHDVVQERASGVERHVEAEVEVVVEVGAGGDHPVDKPRLHERDDAALPEAGRGQGASEAHPDEPLLGEHLACKQQGGLAETSPVVGQQSLFNEVRGRDLPSDAQRVEPGVGGELA